MHEGYFSVNHVLLGIMVSFEETDYLVQTTPVGVDMGFEPNDLVLFVERYRYKHIIADMYIHRSLAGRLFRDDKQDALKQATEEASLIYPDPQNGFVTVTTELVWGHDDTVIDSKEILNVPDTMGEIQFAKHASLMQLHNMNPDIPKREIRAKWKVEIQADGFIIF